MKMLLIFGFAYLTATTTTFASCNTYGGGYQSFTSCSDGSSYSSYSDGGGNTFHTGNDASGRHVSGNSYGDGENTFSEGSVFGD